MTTIKEAVTDMLSNHAISVEEAADRHFSPGFRQKTNGHWDDRAGFVARIDELRRVTTLVSINVLNEMVEGRHYAERHTIDLLGADGRHIVLEVYLFATFDSAGKFHRIEEANFSLSEG